MSHFRLFAASAIGIFCLIGELVAGDASIQVNSMLSFFGANCSLNGEMTRDASKSVNALIDTLKSLKDSDPDCRSVVGAVSSLNLVGQQLAVMGNPATSDDLTALGLESRRREIFLVLSEPGLDPSVTLALQTELRTAQLSLAELNGFNSGQSANIRHQRRGRSAEMVVVSAQSALQTLANNQACWIKYPSLLNEAAGLASILGTAVSATDPTIGGILAGAGLNLMTNLLNYIQRAQLSGQIRDLSRAVQPTSLTCALESLANQWCAAQDSIEAVQLVAEAVENPVRQGDEAWRGVKLLERELPTLTAWLESVRAGSRPSTIHQGETREQLGKRKEVLESTQEIFIGSVNEKQKIFDGIKGTPDQMFQQKWAIVRELVTKTVARIYGGTVNFGGGVSVGAENPMSKVNTDVDGPYILIGLERAPRNSLGSVIRFAEFDPRADLGGQKFEPSLNVLREKFSQWFVAAQTLFSAERRQVLNDDPMSIVTQAKQSTLKGRAKGLSAYGSGQTLLHFLKNQKISRLPSPALSVLFNDTLVRLQEILAAIDAGVEGAVAPDEVLSKVSERAVLVNGVDFIQNRLEFFIRVVLEDLIFSSTDVSKSQRLQLLAAEDIVSSFRDFTGKSYLQLEISAKAAQGIASNAIGTFLEIFDAQLSEAMTDLKRSSARLSEGPQGPNNISRAVLCLNLMAAPEWPKSISFTDCVGAQIDSPFKKGPSIRFSQARWLMPFDKRICVYRDFLRRNYVYQVLAQGGYPIERWNSPMDQSIEPSLSRDSSEPGEPAANSAETKPKKTFLFWSW